MKLLTIDVVARRLGVTPQTVYRIGKENKLKIRSVGPKKGYRVLESDLLKFVENSLIEIETE